MESEWKNIYLTIGKYSYNMDYYGTMERIRHMDKTDNTPTTELITQSLKTIHSIAVAECIQSYKPNPFLASNINPVSYTHLTLPTNREV